MLFQPDTAQSVLEVNSVFVFAIIIATLNSFNSTETRPIEIYIMLQISFGFFFTTISVFGLRPQLLRSQSTAHLFKGFKRLPGTIKESAIIIGEVPSLKNVFRSYPTDSLSQLTLSWTQGYLNAITEINNTYIQIDLSGFSFMKMQGLAWSGVLWRSAIAGVLAGLNLAFWFGKDPGNATPGACVPVPLIFMFSKLPLQGRILTLFRVGAIMIAPIVFLPALFLSILSLRITVYLFMIILREISCSVDPILQGRTQASFDRINQVLEQAQIRAPLQSQLLMLYTRQVTRQPAVAALGWALSPLRSWRDFVEFFLSSDVDNIKMTDILKLWASLAGSDITIAEKISTNRRPTITKDGSLRCVKGIPKTLFLPSLKLRKNPGLTLNDYQSTRESKLASRFWATCWNVLTLCVIAWFILSIELTIRWNEIQGVDTIDSTGQLIPFIIGVTSSAAALDTLVVAIIKKVRIY